MSHPLVSKIPYLSKEAVYFKLTAGGRLTRTEQQWREWVAISDWLIRQVAESPKLGRFFGLSGHLEGDQMVWERLTINCADSSACYRLAPQDDEDRLGGIWYGELVAVVDADGTVHDEGCVHDHASR